MTVSGCALLKTAERYQHLPRPVTATYFEDYVYGM